LSPISFFDAFPRACGRPVAAEPAADKRAAASIQKLQQQGLTLLSLEAVPHCLWCMAIETHFSGMDGMLWCDPSPSCRSSLVEVIRPNPENQGRMLDL
jgi:hypothetical protein